MPGAARWKLVILVLGPAEWLRIKGIGRGRHSARANIYAIASYNRRQREAILRNHFKNKHAYFGWQIMGADEAIKHHRGNWR